jgi:AraC-like DNA-binding protein
MVNQLTETLINGDKMESFLTQVGIYVSGLGGAPKPAWIEDGQFLFEVITAGRVHSPSGKDLRGAGWVFCHGPGEHTIWKSEPDSHYECLTLRFNLAGIRVPEDWPRSFRWNDADAAVTFANEMLYAYHHTNVARDVLGDLVWSQLRFKLDQFRRSRTEQSIPPRISKAIRYIERYYSQEVGIKELADEVAMSPSHFHAKFKAAVELSPHQYLIMQRMREARHALVTTDDPIKAISHHVGYPNTENFCRAFKRHFKTTAAAYRMRYTRIGLTG